MSWFELAAELTPSVQHGDTSTAITRISEKLRMLPSGPYHSILHLDFTNSPQNVSSHFDRFIEAQKGRHSVAAIYTETNGFDINPDRWYFDVFSYKEYGGHDDYDWLAHWDSDNWIQMTLTGMEPLQAVYEADIRADKAHQVAREYCSLLVVAKFQDLVRRSIPFMQELNVPLLATGHDYDFIAEFSELRVNTPKT